MAIERSPRSEQDAHEQHEVRAKPPTIYNEFTGDTLTLDDAYVHRVAEERRAWLERQPLSDDELVRLRAEHPDQAWFWTRAWQVKEREADLGKEGHITRFAGDEGFLRSFDDM